MISLLDANMLIALFDEAHVHHQAAHDWLLINRSTGWATCPLTENACIRIMSQPSYP
jgi:predicted nucleic acid-binding protein